MASDASGSEQDKERGWDDSTSSSRLSFEFEQGPKTAKMRPTELRDHIRAKKRALRLKSKFLFVCLHGYMRVSSFSLFLVVLAYW